MAINRDFWIKQAEHCEQEARESSASGNWLVAALYEDSARKAREYAKEYDVPPIDIAEYCEREACIAVGRGFLALADGYEKSAQRARKENIHHRCSCELCRDRGDEGPRYYYDDDSEEEK